MSPHQMLSKAVDAAFTAGMTYDQIVDAVKTLAALKEHSQREPA